MKKYLISLASSLLLAASVAPTVYGETTFPIVEEPITLEYFVGKGPQNYQVDWNDDFEFWMNYEELTNIHVDWEQISSEAIEEQRNLVLVSGDYPDVFYNAGFTNSDLFRYGSQGVFLPLNDIIEEHAPNLTQILEEHPEVRAAITFPDGNIYGMPVLQDGDHLSARAGATPWISMEAIDSSGEGKPETTEDLYNYLTYVKENMDGKIPLGAPGIDYIVNYLAGSFGIMNNGNANGPIDVDPETNELRFYATSDQYKEFLQYLNKLYSEQLIDPNIFTIQWNQYVANQNEDKYAMFLFWGPDKSAVDEFASKYTHLSAVEGPHGDKAYVNMASMVISNSGFVVTTENENPEAAVAWVDYFYGKEGSLLFNTGVEGETFNYDENGEIERIMKTDEIPYHLPSLGNNQGMFYKDTTETTPYIEEAMVDFEPVVITPWATFTYTPEENDFLVTAGADIDKFVVEMRDQFISGQLSFDDWDQYVSTLEAMGIEDYLAVKQAAYSRTQE